MANQRNQNQRRPARSDPRKADARRRDSRRDSAGRRQPSRSSDSRRRSRRPSQPSLLTRLMQLRPKPDFRPDTQEHSLLKKLHLTQLQRGVLAKWGLYIVLLMGLSMIQDVIMPHVSLFDATTDLVACGILLITVMEGVDTGTPFVLIAACLYYFSGSSPGPSCVGLLVFLGVGACLFRQMFWHRNRGSIVLCAGLALLLYEMGTFLVGVLTGLTRWDRVFHFLITAGISVVLMLPLYSLVNVIGQIGGNTWKE